MNDEQNTLSKREALDSLLAEGDVLLQVDPRVDGVQVPDEFREQPLLVLRIGLEMPIPIPDLVIDDDSIRATLSFNREPHPVVLPWSAVFGLVSEHGQGLLWTADVPFEVMDQVMELTSTDPSGAEDAPDGEEAQKPRLVALDGGRGPDDPSSPTPPRTPPSPLRLIK